MGLIFSEGRLGFVKNYDVARRWYQKAADQEHKGAQDWLKNNNIKICEVNSVSK